LRKVEKKGKGVKVTIKTKKGTETVDADVVLSAVGVTGNIENIGLDKAGVKT
jgi:dihydrolipoamide dehydrogenase